MSICIFQQVTLTPQATSEKVDIPDSENAVSMHLHHNREESRLHRSNSVTIQTMSFDHPAASGVCIGISRSHRDACRVNQQYVRGPT